MYLFPVLFTKLDNYSECEAGWPATKPIELLSGRTYRLVESCQRSAKGGQRIGPSRGVTVRAFFRRFYMEGWSYWNNFSFPLSMTHTHTHTYTHTHTHTYTHICKKSNWKKLGALKTGQAGAVGGPYGSVHIKTPRCHWRCPVMRAARRSSNFIGRIISNDNKAQESFRWKCRTSSVFHTRWMRLPRRRHSLFLCRPGLRSGARTLEHNSALRPEISALHSQGKEETERDFFFFFFFSSFNRDDSPLFFFCKHSATNRTTWPECTGEILLL